MERRSLKSINSGSQLFLRPLSKYTTHPQSRRKILGTLSTQASSLSPDKSLLPKAPAPKASSHSLTKLSVSSSSRDLKPYTISNLKQMHPRSNRGNEKFHDLPHKNRSSFFADISKYNLSTISEQLPKVVTMIVSKTVTGIIAGRVKKHNQDAFFALNNFNDTPNQVFIGVMDGHGVYGGQVSHFVKSMLPGYFSGFLGQEGSC